MCNHCTLDKLWVVGRVWDLCISSLAPCSGSYNTLYFTAFPHVCSVRCAQRPASYSRCNACILAMLYTYYPVCDARMGATCTLISCHIWRCHVWYVCHIYVLCFAQLFIMLLVSCKVTHLHTPASRSKLTCIASVGRTVTFNTQVVLTGA